MLTVGSPDGLSCYPDQRINLVIYSYKMCNILILTFSYIDEQISHTLRHTSSLFTHALNFLSKIYMYMSNLNSAITAILDCIAFEVVMLFFKLEFSKFSISTSKYPCKACMPNINMKYQLSNNGQMSLKKSIDLKVCFCGSFKTIARAFIITKNRLIRVHHNHVSHSI